MLPTDRILPSLTATAVASGQPGSIVTIFFAVKTVTSPLCAATTPGSAATANMSASAPPAVILIIPPPVEAMLRRGLRGCHGRLRYRPPLRETRLPVGIDPRRRDLADRLPAEVEEGFGPFGEVGDLLGEFRALHQLVA